MFVYPLNDWSAVQSLTCSLSRLPPVQQVSNRLHQAACLHLGTCSSESMVHILFCQACMAIGNHIICQGRGQELLHKEACFPDVLLPGHAALP